MSCSPINGNLPKGWTKEDWETFKKQNLNKRYNEQAIEDDLQREMEEIRRQGIDKMKSLLHQEFKNPDHQPVGIEWY